MKRARGKQPGPGRGRGRGRGRGKAASVPDAMASVPAPEVAGDGAEASSGLKEKKVKGKTTAKKGLAEEALEGANEGEEAKGNQKPSKKPEAADLNKSWLEKAIYTCANSVAS